MPKHTVLDEVLRGWFVWWTCVFATKTVFFSFRHLSFCEIDRGEEMTVHWICKKWIR